jgi:thiol-disulfide isomerase/thioredoxin/Holliday junction resolvase RusA-like endonuclease
MNSSKLALLSFFAAMVCISQAAQLAVTVKPYKAIANAEFAVCIEKSGGNYGFNPYDTIYLSEDGIFVIDNLAIGKYDIAIMHPSSEILFYNIYIQDTASLIKMNVELDRITVPEKIDSIRIVGDFNNWDYENNYIRMKFDNDKKYWYASENETEKDLGEYYFVINNYEKKHNFNIPVAKKKGAWADYHNVGNKNIIFDPKNCKQGKPEPKITISGISEQYSALSDSLNMFVRNFDNMFYTSRTNNDLQGYKTFYNSADQQLNFYIANYKDKFAWLFPEIQYKLLQFAPIELELQLKQGSANNEKIRTSKEYIDNMIKRALVLKGLEKNDLMITSRLIDELNIFSNFYMSSYDLYEELNIPYGYFDNFLVELKKESSNPEICGKILNLHADKIIGNRPEKAKNILLEIKEKYPKYSGITNGSIDKQLKGFDIVADAPAPDFKITSLDGKEISLSSLKGKYVFIDFWGTWCGPCRGEIPNIIEMRKMISADELEIIGLTYRDKEETAKKFILSNGINYTNALATDKIISDYGIRSYPTTFLIDKEGKIIAKNLRGENLVNLVKDAMQ